MGLAPIPRTGLEGALEASGTPALDALMRSQTAESNRRQQAAEVRAREDAKYQRDDRVYESISWLEGQVAAGGVKLDEYRRMPDQNRLSIAGEKFSIELERQAKLYPQEFADPSYRGRWWDQNAKPVLDAIAANRAGYLPATPESSGPAVAAPNPLLAGTVGPDGKPVAGKKLTGSPMSRFTDLGVEGVSAMDNRRTKDAVRKDISERSGNQILDDIVLSTAASARRAVAGLNDLTVDYIAAPTASAAEYLFGKDATVSKYLRGSAEADKQRSADLIRGARNLEQFGATVPGIPRNITPSRAIGAASQLAAATDWSSASDVAGTVGSLLVTPSAFAELAGQAFGFVAGSGGLVGGVRAGAARAGAAVGARTSSPILGRVVEAAARVSPVALSTGQVTGLEARMSAEALGDDLLRAAPQYQEARRRMPNASEEDVREVFLDAVESRATAVGTATALAGMMLGGTTETFFASALSQGVKGALTRIGTGAVLREGGGEFIEEAGQSVARNFGVGAEIDTGAAVQAGLGGALLGGLSAGGLRGAGAAINKFRPVREAPDTEAPSPPAAGTPIPNTPTPDTPTPNELSPAPKAVAPATMLVMDSATLRAGANAKFTPEQVTDEAVRFMDSAIKRGDSVTAVGRDGSQVDIRGVTLEGQVVTVGDSTLGQDGDTLLTLADSGVRFEIRSGQELADAVVPSQAEIDDAVNTADDRALTAVRAALASLDLTPEQQSFLSDLERGLELSNAAIQEQVNVYEQSQRSADTTSSVIDGVDPVAARTPTPVRRVDTLSSSRGIAAPAATTVPDSTRGRVMAMDAPTQVAVLEDMRVQDLVAPSVVEGGAGTAASLIAAAKRSASAYRRQAFPGYTDAARTETPVREARLTETMVRAGAEPEAAASVATAVAVADVSDVDAVLNELEAAMEAAPDPDMQYAIDAARINLREYEAHKLYRKTLDNLARKDKYRTSRGQEGVDISTIAQLTATAPVLPNALPTTPPTDKDTDDAAPARNVGRPIRNSGELRIERGKAALNPFQILYGTAIRFFDGDNEIDVKLRLIERAAVPRGGVRSQTIIEGARNRIAQQMSLLSTNYTRPLDAAIRDLHADLRSVSLADTRKLIAEYLSARAIPQEIANEHLRDKDGLTPEKMKEWATIDIELDSGVRTAGEARLAFEALMNDPNNFKENTYRAQSVRTRPHIDADITAAQALASQTAAERSQHGAALIAIGKKYDALVSYVRAQDRSSGHGGGLQNLIDMYGESGHVIRKGARTGTREDFDRPRGGRIELANTKRGKRKVGGAVIGEETRYDDPIEAMTSRAHSVIHLAADKMFLGALATNFEKIDMAAVAEVRGPFTKVIDPDTGDRSHPSQPGVGQTDQYTFYAGNEFFVLKVNQEDLNVAVANRYDPGVSAQERGGALGAVAVLRPVTRFMSQLLMSSLAPAINSQIRRVLQAPRVAATLPNGALSNATGVITQTAKSIIKLPSVATAFLGSREQRTARLYAAIPDVKGDLGGYMREMLEGGHVFFSGDTMMGDALPKVGADPLTDARIARTGDQQKRRDTLAKPFNKTGTVLGEMLRKVADASSMTDFGHSLAMYAQARKAGLDSVEAAAIMRSVFNPGKTREDKGVYSLAMSIIPFARAKSLGLAAAQQTLTKGSQGATRTLADKGDVYALEMTREDIKKSISYPGIGVSIGITALFGGAMAMTAANYDDDDDVNEDGSSKSTAFLKNVDAAMLMTGMPYISLIDGQLSFAKIEFGSDSLIHAAIMGAFMISSGSHSADEVANAYFNVAQDTAFFLNKVDVRDALISADTMGAGTTAVRNIINTFLPEVFRPVLGGAVNRNAFGKNLFYPTEETKYNAFGQRSGQALQGDRTPRVGSSPLATSVAELSRDTKNPVVQALNYDDPAVIDNLIRSTGMLAYAYNWLNSDVKQRFQDPSYSGQVIIGDAAEQITSLINGPQHDRTEVGRIENEFAGKHRYNFIQATAQDWSDTKAARDAADEKNLTGRAKRDYLRSKGFTESTDWKGEKQFTAQTRQTAYLKENPRFAKWNELQANLRPVMSDTKKVIYAEQEKHRAGEPADDGAVQEAYRQRHKAHNTLLAMWHAYEREEGFSDGVD